MSVEGGKITICCIYSKLEFCTYTKEDFVSFLHGSPSLLSVPFEDVLQDDVASISLHRFLMIHSMSDIFS